MTGVLYRSRARPAVNGEVLTFGNQGALFLRAMTWWDHGTESVWSQPWGTAIIGPLKGTSLTLIPASIVPWPTWLAEHPDTTVVVGDDSDRERFSPGTVPNGLVGGVDMGRGNPSDRRDDFVIGVALEESATAYDYRLVAARRVINDRVGDHPVVVFVDPETRNIKVYLRRPADTPPGEAAPAELTFAMDGEFAVGAETGSEWDVSHGFAMAGPLKGAVLQQIPYVTAFVWAWHNFFPHTAVYGD